MAQESFFADKPSQKKVFDSLFAKIREYSEQNIWSRAVRLTRNAEFIVDDRESTEIHVRIRRRGEAVSPKVSLYLEDQDWACDVDSKDDPCVNTIAAAIALNSGVGLASANDISSAFIKYALHKAGTSLAIQRYIQRADTLEELKRPLHEIAGGSQTGRISGLALALSREDFAVESALGSQRRGIIDPQRMQLVLKALSSFPELEYEKRAIRASSSLPHITVEVFNEKGAFALSLKEELAVSESFTNGAMLIDGVLYPSLTLILGTTLAKIITPPGKILARDEVFTLRKEIIPQLKQHLEVDESEVHYPHIITERPDVELVMEKDNTQLRVYPRITYGSPIVAESDGRELRLLTKNVHVERNLSVEKQLAVKLKQELHLQLGREIVFDGEEAVLFAQRVRHWKTRGKGETAFALLGEVQPKIEVQGDSLQAKFQLRSGSTLKTAMAEDVFRAWEKNEPFVQLIDGGWASLPENWLETHGARLKKLIEIQDGELPNALKPSAAQFLEDIGLAPSQEISEFKQRLLEAKFSERGDVPTDVHAELRHYQKQGVHWLLHLKTAGLGALLADDMGLGKTLQAICTLSAPSLVVAPTSVLPAWKEQIEKFRPSLSVNLYHGPQRQLLPGVDVTITSYAILRNDIEMLRDIQWSVSVLDEAQNIKNPASQLSLAMYSLASDFRICLSGTPVENSLDDLWSQFHFLNPLLLGSQNDFRKQYKRRISLGDTQAGEELRNRISPFMLRRVKGEVLKELPPKTEAKLWVELSEPERELYQSIYASTQKEILDKIDQKGGVFAALEALLRLRQACCHSSLVPGHSAETSQKIELLMGSLNTTVRNGHRALVFSQWTSFLDLIEPHLQNAGLTFSRIDGSTGDRHKVIESFQASEGPNLMLLSLKAGGVGVTLTAADHIYLMDSWWNPAVEEQAADRAHRIGQTHPVFVYRIVAKDTIEENILALQDKKRDLAAAVLSEGGQIETLSKADILDLFQL